MNKCPLCKNEMQHISPEEYNGFTDAFFCDHCQVEHAIHWGSGERVTFHRNQSDESQTLEQT